jgi:hypothetical protein
MKTQRIPTTTYIISLELEGKTTKNLCFHWNRLYSVPILLLANMGTESTCQIEEQQRARKGRKELSKRHIAYQSWAPNAETQRRNLNEKFEKTSVTRTNCALDFSYL